MAKDDRADSASFGEQLGPERGSEPPLRFDELIRELQPRDPIGELPDVALEMEVLLPALGEIGIEVDVESLKGAALYGAVESDASAVRARLSLRNVAIGQHVIPPRVQLVQFESDHDIHEVQRQYPGFEGYLPDHLPLGLLPRPLPRELRVPPRVQTDRVARRDRADDVHDAATIFTPDDRYTFNDTSFPWCTVGRIDTPGGQATGTMVGPRHVLTCNHAIQWNPDNTAGWVKFTPSYFDGSAPFGVAWGTWVYWEGQKVFGPTISRSEGQHDYVCVVLDRRMGDVTGWMGSRSWSDSWDGEPYWRHIGYPGDLAGGQRPSYQGAISLDGSFWDREVHTRIWHRGDVWPGQSGGPFFAWWAGEAWPRVVSDQSGQNSDENSASGGGHMVNCIIRARNDHP